MQAARGPCIKKRIYWSIAIKVNAPGCYPGMRLVRFQLLQPTYLIILGSSIGRAPDCGFKRRMLFRSNLNRAVQYG